MTLYAQVKMVAKHSKETNLEDYLQQLQDREFVDALNKWEVKKDHSKLHREVYRNLSKVLKQGTSVKDGHFEELAGAFWEDIVKNSGSF